MKLTEWYSGDQKPVRIGVYERGYTIRTFFSFWSGKKWQGGGWSTVDRCIENHPFFPDDEQTHPWRGIAK